jgi:hypothetical protein
VRKNRHFHAGNDQKWNTVLYQRDNKGAEEVKALQLEGLKFGILTVTHRVENSKDAELD